MSETRFANGYKWNQYWSLSDINMQGNKWQLPLYSSANTNTNCINIVRKQNNYRYIAHRSHIHFRMCIQCIIGRYVMYIISSNWPLACTKRHHPFSRELYQTNETSLSGSHLFRLHHAMPCILSMFTLSLQRYCLLISQFSVGTLLLMKATMEIWCTHRVQLLPKNQATNIHTIAYCLLPPQKSAKSPGEPRTLCGIYNWRVLPVWCNHPSMSYSDVHIDRNVAFSSLSLN